MPIIAAGAALWSGAALAAGGLSVLGTIAAVGAVVAGVGAVTGNQDLAKIGGVMGLVGGIGALANNAGVFGGVADQVSAMESAADMAEAGAGEGMRATAEMSQVAADATASTAVQTMPLLDPQNPTGAIIDGEVSVNPVDAATEQVVAAASKGGSTAAGEIAKQAMSAPASSWTNGFDLPGGGDPAKSIWKTMLGKEGLLGWAEKNQMLASGIMNVGGKFMEGLFDPTAQAKEDYMKSQAELNKAQTGLVNQRTATAAAPAPVASTGTAPRKPVFRTGPAPVYVPPMPGLINSVTGSV